MLAFEQIPKPIPASIAHSAELAYLVNLAGEGLPYYLWSQIAEPGESPFEVGRQRACRESGGFSYRHAWVIEQEQKAVSAIVGYPLQHEETESETDATSPIAPLLELEALAGASWYVNVLATFKDFRCQGMGSLLLNHVEQLAIDSGCRDMSLIVSSNNTSARKLYQSLGYQTRACRPSIPFPDSGSIGEWELMMKAL